MYQSPDRGFFAKVFDLSFRDFVTPTIISVVYVIVLMVLGLYALGIVWSGFETASYFGYGGPSFGSVLLHLAGAALLFVVGAIIARVQLEFVMAVFKIAENTAPKE